MKQVICVRSSFLEQVTYQRRMALDRVAIRVSPRNPTRQITQSGINYNRARTRSGQPLGLEWSHIVETQKSWKCEAEGDALVGSSGQCVWAMRGGPVSVQPWLFTDSFFPRQSPTWSRTAASARSLTSLATEPYRLPAFRQSVPQPEPSASEPVASLAGLDAACCHHAIEAKQKNRADDGGKETDGLAISIPAQASAEEAATRAPATPSIIVTMIPPGS